MHAAVIRNKVFSGIRYFLLLLLIFWFQCFTLTPPSRAELIDYQKIKTRYGITGKVKSIEKKSLRSGQNLAEILKFEKVPYSRIHKAVKKSEGIFNLKSLRAGKSYYLINAPWTENSNDFKFIYEINSVDYVVFDFREEPKVYRGNRPVHIRKRMVEGVIDSSLMKAFAAQKVPAELAESLSEIYAWTVDFYHFQKGDAFRLIYEEHLIGKKPVDVGRILAARLTHEDKDYYAFRFDAEGRGGVYFDENGNSLKKAFLKAPLKFVKITSGFSKRRLHPITHQYKPHPGIDFAAPKGTPVMSVGAGVVEKREYNRSCGRYLQIRHSSRYMTQYLHLSRYAEDMKPGTRIEQGEVIGYVGSSGRATGPHLDFRFWDNGVAVNYLELDNIRIDPLTDAPLERFLARTADLKNDLDADQIRTYSAELSPRTSG